jgi:hypothetical protein
MPVRAGVPYQPYSFLIKKLNGLTVAQDDKGVVRFSGADPGTVVQKAVNALPNGGTVFLKEVQLPDTVTYGNNILIIQDYQGERIIYSKQGRVTTPRLAADPDTAGWGAAEKGRRWFNTTDNKEKFWDGSQIQSIPSVVGGVAYELPASYVVYIEGTTVKAQNGHTGNVDYSGSDAKTVIQNVLNALTAGGVIFFKPGTYTMTGQLSKTSGSPVYLFGSGRGVTTFSFTSALGSNPGIYCTVSGCHWEGFTMDMNGYGTNAIELYNASTNFIRDVEILECAQDGINLSASAERNSNKIVDCRIHQPQRYGVYIGANIGHTWIERSIISDSTTSTKVTDAAIYITTTAKHNKILNNAIWGTIVGIYIATAAYHLMIHDNSMTDCWTHIQVDASTGDLHICNNNFWYVGRAHTSPGDAQSDIYFNTTGIQYAVSINGNNGNGQDSSYARHFIYCTTSDILRGVMTGNSCQNYYSKYAQGTQTNLVAGSNY